MGTDFQVGVQVSGCGLGWVQAPRCVLGCMWFLSRYQFSECESTLLLNVIGHGNNFLKSTVLFSFFYYWTERYESSHSIKELIFKNVLFIA